MVVLSTGAGAGAAERPRAIPLGKGDFLPSVEISTSERRNLFQQSEAAVDARVDILSATLRYELPLSRSLFTLEYRPAYESYENDVIESNLNHQAEASLELRTSRGLELLVEDRFERGILEVDTISGGEARFGGRKFTHNEGTVALRLPLSRRQGIELGAFTGQVDFQEDEVASFFDIQDRGGVIGYFRRLTDTLRLGVDLRVGSTDQERAPVVTFDPETGESVRGEGTVDQDFDELQWLIALEGELGSRTTVRYVSGYGRFLYENDLGSDYSGLMVDGNLAFKVTRSFTAELTWGRRPQSSFFNVANYFVNEHVGTKITKTTSRRLRMSLEGRIQRNEYRDPISLDLNGDGIDDILPDPDSGFVAGRRRLDRLRSAQARLDFLIVPGRWGVYLQGSYVRRSSRLEVFEYDSSGISFGLRFGWLPQ